MDAAARLDTQAQEITHRIDDRLQSLDETIRMQGGALVERLSAQVEHYNARIGDNSRHFADEIDARLAEIDGAIESKGGHLVEKLGARAIDIASTMSNKIEAFENVANARTMEAADRIDELVGRVDAGLGVGGQMLQEALSKHAAEVARVMEDGGRQVMQTLDAKIKDVDWVLLSRSSELAHTIASRTEEINEALGGHAKELETTLDGRIALLENNVISRLGAVSSEIDEGGRLVVDTIGARLQDIKDVLAVARREFDTTLHARTGDLGQSLAERVAEISGALDARLTQMQTVLNARGGAVAQELTTIGDLVTTAVENSSAALVSRLGVKRDELTNALDASREALALTLETSAQTSIAALLETNERIRAELPTLLDTLGETNASLHAVIDKTGGNLVTLEHELGKRLAEFHGALSEASTQVEHISAVAGGTMQDANAIVAALDERQHTLAQSAEKLAQSQEALDAVMAARRRSLEELVTLIEGRRAEFESAMTQFGELMDRSFRSIETRSRDLGGELSETSRQTADLIETRFAAVRAAAEGEREQTSEALRAAFFEANEEITRLFGDARSKFDAATDEIRGLARNIHREIEETREEVRRGATEIPRETAEQAAALRRVVGDQVKALNELTDIVARSGRVYDIAEQSASPLRQPALDQPTRAEHAAAPRVAQNRSAEPTREPPGGWLSNLLARASFDDAAPQPPRTARSLATAGALDSLTLDIARMVDNAAVAELWRRYQRGEKGGLFGRRLYTAQGHQTFEEIRRRYRVDQAFRATADRYVTHFEDLLIETSRGDHDGSKALDLLTGDAGKVYTMLSHASGRFE